MKHRLLPFSTLGSDLTGLSLHCLHAMEHVVAILRSDHKKCRAAPLVSCAASVPRGLDVSFVHIVCLAWQFKTHLKADIARVGLATGAKHDHACLHGARPIFVLQVDREGAVVILLNSAPGSVSKAAR